MRCMPTVHPLLPLLLLACSRWPCTALVDNSTALVALFEESEAGFLVLPAQPISPTLGQPHHKADRVRPTRFFCSHDGGCTVYALGRLPRRRALSSCAHGVPAVLASRASTGKNDYFQQQGVSHDDISIEAGARVLWPRF